jgi:hypothetical protein
VNNELTKELLNGRSPDRREGITEGEELENAGAGEERMEAHNWEGQSPIWASNNELERTRKEMDMTNLNYYLSICLEYLRRIFRRIFNVTADI